MCGIAGSWGGDPERVARMIEAQRHRGPDEHAVAFSEEGDACSELLVGGRVEGCELRAL